MLPANPSASQSAELLRVTDRRSALPGFALVVVTMRPLQKNFSKNRIDRRGGGAM